MHSLQPWIAELGQSELEKRLEQLKRTRKHKQAVRPSVPPYTTESDEFHVRVKAKHLLQLDKVSINSHNVGMRVLMIAVRAEQTPLRRVGVRFRDDYSSDILNNLYRVVYQNPSSSI